MELKLNIYNEEGIEKTYVTETYDIMFGTVEDLMDVIDIDKTDDDKEFVKMIYKGFKLLKPFLKDIFEGLTDDELKRVKVKEIIPVFVTVFQFAFEQLIGVSDGKN